MFSFEFGFLCIFLAAVFSARALGAGFRPGVHPTVSTALTKGRTGRRFFAALPEGSCGFCTYRFGLRPQL